MTLGDFFGCTFVINLAERKDRRAQITRELEAAGMPFSPGKVEIFPAVRPIEALGFPSPGVRGCFLSHLGILKLARERRLSSVLILEDDLVISPLVREFQDHILSFLSTARWDMVYFGHIEQVSNQSPPGFIPFTGPLVTAHFYAVNGPLIGRLIDYLEQVQTRPPGDPDGGPMHLDGALNMFRQRNPDTVTLIAQPNLGWQRPSRSDLHSTWLQSAPVFRHGYDLARNVRALFRKRSPRG